MTGTQRRLTGRIQVALPPGEAFRLFTPRGEEEWVHGWQPRFPAQATDDTEPGTVFETSAHGQHTIWVVMDRQPGKRISYARVTPGDQAGTVTVTISPAGHHSEVEVTYQLTALTDAARGKLSEFADGYHAYLQSWQDAITAWLHNALAAGGAVGAKQRPVLRTGFWVLFVDGLNAGDDRSTATAQADFLQIGLAGTRSCGCRARAYEVVQCLRCGQLGQLPRYLLPYPGQVDAEDPLPASERVYDLVG